MPSGKLRWSAARPPNQNLIYHGLSIAEIVERIDPATDALGISVMFSQQWPHVEDIIRAIHARFPDLPIFIGGEHVAGAWEFVLDNCPAVTACAIGEGEETMVELVGVRRGPAHLADVNGSPAASTVGRSARRRARGSATSTRFRVRPGISSRSTSITTAASPTA